MASTLSSSDEYSEQQQQQQQDQSAKDTDKECVHKTKTIQFLGRTTPIVLQNDNGPCPLLAICNVLLLKNNLNLSPDIAEVSQEKLLSLVAERLIDSNANVNNKDAGYLENQQQNIADAIDLLPRLATGIDVNIKFRRIDDFEFTPECAIFDLLDIPLYHGWIVDPQDYDTANAIGSKSYNALTAELVALETQKMEGNHKNDLDEENKNDLGEDCVDFAAATTATLGVPSPSLSKTRSFDESPCSDHLKLRKGDLEEEAELLKAIKMSEADLPTSVGESLMGQVNDGVVSVDLDGTTCMKIFEPADSLDTSKDIGVDTNHSALTNDNNKLTSPENLQAEIACSSIETDQSVSLPKSTNKDSEGDMSCSDVATKDSIEKLVWMEGLQYHSSGKNTEPVDMDVVQGGEKFANQSTSTTNVHEPAEFTTAHDMEMSGISACNPESDSSSGAMQNTDSAEAFTSSVDGSEPIYEGEECILDSGAAVYEDREPMYEGEVILAEQADKTVRPNDEITSQQGKLIRNFLNSNANQLTFYGLFCLQDGLKERELCVFFRNNHFSTMFKYDGDLYLLATDQGFINQPDLVWEKLNEVNGDSLFMTGNFKEFKIESHESDRWDEQNALDSTADYISRINTDPQDMNADLQLAIALQQQEFGQQHLQRNNLPQPSVSSSSRLVTGPQVPRSSVKNSSSTARTEAKSKDRCNVM
ncbi:hypothetical protein K2173_018216 [Erythroxylum novogranatense]|uniref:MINDY deubiquitinase domain-containing protein n=1 Tax=Erythroxylum novogranatense TaxID=1862640 RepID=A0AAV8TP87_9ROSI|nr:hypothetical protein K2173_018216 [Erythroxylum novogranatense]